MDGGFPFWLFVVVYSFFKPVDPSSYPGSISLSLSLSMRRVAIDFGDVCPRSNWSTAEHSCLCAGNPDQARAEHLQSSNQEIGGSVLGNQTPSAPFLEETMARKKVTTEEAQRIKKTREIKQRKNSLKAEQVSAPIEVMDLKIVSVLSLNKFLIVYMCCAIYMHQDFYPNLRIKSSLYHLFVPKHLHCTQFFI